MLSLARLQMVELIEIIIIKMLKCITSEIWPLFGNEKESKCLTARWFLLHEYFASNNILIVKAISLFPWLSRNSLACLRILSLTGIKASALSTPILSPDIFELKMFCRLTMTKYIFQEIEQLPHFFYQ